MSHIKKASVCNYGVLGGAIGWLSAVFSFIVSLFLYLRHIYFTHTHTHTQQVNGEAMLFIITRPEK